MLDFPFAIRFRKNGEVIDHSTVKKLIIEEKEVPKKKTKLLVFEKQLTHSLETY